MAARALLGCMTFFWRAIVAAQTIGGQVVELGTHKPAGRVSIGLMSDSARVVASGVSDSATGMFYVDAPKPGGYRVALVLKNGESFISPRIVLDSGQTIEREFEVPKLAVGSDVYFATDVDSAVRPLRASPVPRFPNSERVAHERGLVSIAVVIDTTGRAEMDSYRLLNEPSPAFARAVHDAMPDMRFRPAFKNGRPVRQLVAWSIGFGFFGDPPAGDLMIQAQSPPSFR